MDDLHAVVDSNVARRNSALPAAEAVVADEADKFWQWVAGLAAVPVLTQFRDEMNRVRERELTAALRRLPELTPEQRATVEHFSHALMNKFLHEPSVRLRAAAANGRGLGVVDAARYLFALDERGPAPAADTETRADLTASAATPDAAAAAPPASPPAARGER
jgi:glutamyl-tRNA reductase